MSQERWDVVVRYLTGPLSIQGEQVYRGPVIRMGANPGPGGVTLAGYRGLDARHAVITSYEGGQVAIAPVGNAQVRVAPHENVDWNEVQVIPHPVYLQDGCAVHLGPPGRGLTFLFVECRRLGVWEEHRILSDAAQVSPEVEPTRIQELSTEKGMPTWFIGGVVMAGIVTAVAVLFSLFRFYENPIAGLGPTGEGVERYEYVPVDMELNSELREGLDQPFADFLMIPNARAADWKALAEDPAQWDQRLLDQVTRSVQLHAQGWAFFKRLEAATEDWAFVVGELRKAGLPEVFAAIPYQESRYTANAVSPVCARGFWQFMPEVANRAGVRVRECSMKGGDVLWSPTAMVVPVNARKRAEYVSYNAEKNTTTCLIRQCAVDERSDLAASTRGAVTLLQDVMKDPDLRRSGALLQIAITSHNTGYDDARFDEGGRGRRRIFNVKPAYQRYLEARRLDRGPFFVGDNITCASATFVNDACGGFLMDQSQHYAYNIIAQHFLAVCYYGAAHGDLPAFKPWRGYVRGDGYCTRFQVPSLEKVREKMSQ
ncbi:MAG: transglycosylase SLT domain-containing protein [Deltaproteobacteria bacterium]|nr:transglycosylase SLT domain-containing protein [Deltaproteobacteria bacterium]